MKDFTKILLLFVLILSGTVASAQSYGYYYAGDRYHDLQPYHRKIHRILRHNDGFRWVSTHQIQDGRRHLVVVTLQNRNRFIEITMNHRGDIIDRHRYVLRPNHRSRHHYRRGNKVVVAYYDGYRYDGRKYDWNSIYHDDNEYSYRKRNRDW